MEQLITASEIIGTIAFAISGALIAARKQLDVFGVTVLGAVTAIGGGILRDLIIGINPPLAFQDSGDALLAAIVALLVFFAYNHRLIKWDLEVYNKLLLAADSIGLATFTVVGLQVAYQYCSEVRTFLFLFSAVITGCGGGILRDVLLGETPLVFVKHVYASASLVGAVLFMLLYGVSRQAALFAGIVSIVVIRILAATRHWNLPKAKEFEN